MDEFLINGTHTLSLSGEVIDRLLLYLNDLSALISISEGNLNTIEIAPGVQIDTKDLSTFKGFIKPDDLNAIDTIEELELFVDDKIFDLVASVDTLDQNVQNLFTAASENAIDTAENLTLINDLKFKLIALNNGNEHVDKSINQMIASSIATELEDNGAIKTLLDNKVDKVVETIPYEVIIPTTVVNGYLVADAEDQEHALYVIDESNAYLQDQGISINDERISAYVTAGILKPGDQVVLNGEIEKTYMLSEENFKSIYKVYLDLMMSRTYLDKDQVTRLVTTQIIDRYNELLNRIITIENNKVDKVAGKTLSTNDFTDDYKNKIDSIITDENQIKQIIDDAFDSVFKNN